MTVVGAGLAGLTAAINCARAGHEVTVLERFKEVGGLPRVHPAVDATPMRPERLGRFIGVELGPPYLRPTETVAMYCYGKRYEFPGSQMHLWSAERGSRETSLDHYLYRTALAAGVKFEFGHEYKTSDAAWLPPNSILATGLFFEPFSELCIPYVQLYGFVARGRYEGPTRVAAFFDDYSRDYCYYAHSNGVSFGLAFARRPVDASLKERWKRQLAEWEGLEFLAWDDHEGVAPIARWDNPRLFWGDKILAGTFSGMQDPFLLFGVHGALVSGRIAAMAVDDKKGAYDLFRRMTGFFKYSFALRRLLDAVPHPARRAILRSGLSLAVSDSRAPGFVMERVLHTIPGLFQLP
ncbi:MAG: NAD(P)/FAD-dependent oxidoreductase [Candidatus Geothermincolia bacterium]